jgi:hypothetical protein
MSRRKQLHPKSMKGKNEWDFIRMNSVFVQVFILPRELQYDEKVSGKCFDCLNIN